MEFTFTIYGRLPGMNEYTEKQRMNAYAGSTFKRKHQRNVETSIMVAGHYILTSPVRITYRFYEPNKRRDKDNISGFAHKVINDALVKTRVLKDDGWDDVCGYVDEFAIDRKNPRIVVTVEEVQ